MRLDPEIKRQVEAAIGAPVPPPTDPEFDELLLRLRREKPQLAELLESGVLFDELPTPEEETVKAVSRREGLRMLKHRLFDRYDELTGEWVPSRPKQIALGFVGLVAATSLWFALSTRETSPSAGGLPVPLPAAGQEAKASTVPGVAPSETQKASTQERESGDRPGPGAPVPSGDRPPGGPEAPVPTEPLPPPPSGYTEVPPPPTNLSSSPNSSSSPPPQPFTLSTQAQPVPAQAQPASSGDRLPLTLVTSDSREGAKPLTLQSATVLSGDRPFGAQQSPTAVPNGDRPFGVQRPQAPVLSGDRPFGVQRPDAAVPNGDRPSPDPASSRAITGSVADDVTALLEGRTAASRGGALILKRETQSTFTVQQVNGPTGQGGGFYLIGGRGADASGAQGPAPSGDFSAQAQPVPSGDRPYGVQRPDAAVPPLPTFPQEGAAPRPQLPAPYTPGTRLKGRLGVGVLIAEGAPGAVAVDAEDGSTWVGEVTLDETRRLRGRLTRVIKDGREYPTNATLLDAEGTLGVAARVREEAPSIAADLIRGSLRGVSDYISAASQAKSVTVLPGGGVAQSTQTPPLELFMAGSLANLFSLQQDKKAVVRVAQVERGTEVMILVVAEQSSPAS